MFIYNNKNDEYSQTFNPENDAIQLVQFHETHSNCSSTRSYSDPNPKIISKSGRRNIHLRKVPNKHITYFRDLGNTLLHIRWRWILIILCLVNFTSFYIFGVLWMWLAYISGDFDENVQEYCVVNTKNLTGYILLSIETMQTIGYGFRYPTEKCIQGWLLPFLQALVSLGIQGVLVTAVCVKISKPFTKNSIGLFSKKAVIYLRDGNLCLVVRVSDLTGKVSVATRIAMYFVDKEDPLYIREIKIEPYGFLIFPSEVVHVIDRKSPLWQLKPQALLSKRFEIIVVVEGNSMVTGQLSQNRTSYSKSDVFWGHRFAPCVEFDESVGKYRIDCKNFNRLVPLDTPLCSAQELCMIERRLK